MLAFMGSDNLGLNEQGRHQEKYRHYLYTNKYQENRGLPPLGIKIKGSPRDASLKSR